MRLRSVLLSIAFVASLAHAQIGIVANQNLLQLDYASRDEIYRFRQLIEAVEGKSVWIEGFSYSWQNPSTTKTQALRSLIQSHYENDANALEGIIFIGDLPYVTVWQRNETTHVYYDCVVDEYWMDVDENWSLANWTSSMPRVDYTGPNTYPEADIWVSHVPSHAVIKNGYTDRKGRHLVSYSGDHTQELRDPNGNLITTEAGVLQNYFGRVKNRMTQPPTVSRKCLVFADHTNWPNWQLILKYPSLGYPQADYSTYTAPLDQNVWLNHLRSGNYEFATESAHGATTIAITDTRTLCQSSPQTLTPFFELTSCFATDYTMAECIANRYALGNNGLATVGVTWSSVTTYHAFNTELSEGGSFGDALLRSVNSGGIPSYMLFTRYRQALIGAGTLKLAPYVAAGQDVSFVDETPGFSGASNPEEDYTSLTSALSSTSNGDRIYVYGGQYNENWPSIYNSNLEVIGQAHDKPYFTTPIRVYASGVTVENIIIQPTWTHPPGDVTELGIGATNEVYMIGNRTSGRGPLYKWMGYGWSSMGVNAERVDVDPNGRPWIIVNGAIKRREANGTWTTMPAVSSYAAPYDIGIGADGTVCVIGTYYSYTALYRYEAGTNSWTYVSSPYRPIRVTVDPQGRPLIVDISHNIYRYEAGEWRQLPGTASQISAGADGMVYSVSYENYPGSANKYIRVWSGKQWYTVPGAAVEVEVDAHGNPWVWNSARDVFYSVNQN